MSRLDVELVHLLVRISHHARRPMSNSLRTLSGIAPTAAWSATPLVRIMVGAVFLAEGIQKFLYPGMRGPGRFESMGWPAPEVMGYLVGGTEIVAGALLLIGLYTRGAAFVTASIMTVAIITTKIPIWMGEGFGPFVVRDLGVYGFWSMAHAMRTDWAMLLGSLFLLIVGAGPWSVDAWGTDADPKADS